MHETRTIKVWKATYRRLRRICAETDETLVALVDRLARAEAERLHMKESKTEPPQL